MSIVLSAADTNYCLLVPHFNHHQQLTGFLPQLVALDLPILVVDDGSDILSKQALTSMVASYNSVQLHQFEKNHGKGVAVMEGIRLAQAQGFDYVVQVDADGQHNPADVNKLIATSRANPDCMVSGLPRFGSDISAARRFGREISLFFVRLETLSSEVRDAMCGFRVYPINSMLEIDARTPLPARMQFDLEALVRWKWTGRHLRFVATDVCYPEHGLSHFRMLRDNIEISLMHTKLCIGMLWRAPKLLLWKIKNA